MRRLHGRSLMMAPLNRYGAVLKRPGMRPFLGGLGVSSLGNAMDEVTIVWVAATLSPQSSPLLVGLSTAAYLGPGVIISAFGSDQLARWSPRFLVQADSCMRAAALGLLGALSLSGRLTPAVLVGVLALGGTLSTAGRASLYSIIRDLSDAQDYFPSNALRTGIVQGTFLVGPAIAGVLISWTGPGVVLVIDALTFLAMVAAVLALPYSAGRARSDKTSVRPSGDDPDSTAMAWSLVVLTAVFFTLYGPIVVVLPEVLRTNLKLPDQSAAAWLGYAWSGLGAGAVLSGVLLGGRDRLVAIRTLGVIVVAWGIATAFVGLARSTWWLLAAMIAGGVAYGPYAAIVSTLLQKHLPEEPFRRFANRYSAVANGSPPIGYVLGGAAAAALSSTAVLLASAAVLVVAGSAFALAHRRIEPSAPR